MKELTNTNLPISSFFLIDSHHVSVWLAGDGYFDPCGLKCQPWSWGQNYRKRHRIWWAKLRPFPFLPANQQPAANQTFPFSRETTGNSRNSAKTQEHPTSGFFRDRESFSNWKSPIQPVKVRRLFQMKEVSIVELVFSLTKMYIFLVYR